MCQHQRRTGIFYELGGSLHAGPSLVVVAKVEGPNSCTEHSRMLLSLENRE